MRCAGITVQVARFHSRLSHLTRGYGPSVSSVMLDATIKGGKRDVRESFPSRNSFIYRSLINITHLMTPDPTATPPW